MPPLAHKSVAGGVRVRARVGVGLVCADEQDRTSTTEVRQEVRSRLNAGRTGEFFRQVAGGQLKYFTPAQATPAPDLR